MNKSNKHIALAAAAFALLGAATGAQAQSAGTWTVKAGWNNIDPHVKSGALSASSLPDTRIDVKQAGSPLVTLMYMLTDRISIEACGGLYYKHDVVGDGAIAGVGTLGTVKQVSPTVFLQYRFNDATAPFRPYVGIGATYGYFYGERGSNALTSLTNPGGPPTQMSTDNAWGASPQIGASYRFNDRWVVDAAVIKTFLKTTSHLSTGQSVDTKLDPVSINVSIGYRF